MFNNQRRATGDPDTTELMTTSNNSSDGIRIDVLVCTHRRASLEDTLRSIEAQLIPDNFVIRVIVADNDVQPSACTLVRRVADEMRTPVSYVHAPALNISVARNATLDAASADWVAFIDDDEVASPVWLASLYQAAKGLDAVFGPVIATYTADAPAWIQARDYHSTWPQTRGGVVQTGYAGNALLRWSGSPFTGERFLPEKGPTGGEDTEFFFRLWRKGARLGIAANATVSEAVSPDRLTFSWISTRKFRAGQTYGRHAASRRLDQVLLAIAATGKAAACAAMAVITTLSLAQQRYWTLRGIFHAGVLAAQFGGKERALYGS